MTDDETVTSVSTKSELSSVSLHKVDDDGRTRHWVLLRRRGVGLSLDLELG